MGFIKYNANPMHNRTSDCVIRAISTLTNESWDDIYIDLSLQGFLTKDMMSVNSVWGNYLIQRGYSRHMLPNTCPMCYTVKDFCYDFPFGKYMVSTGTHVIAVIDGNYYDTWDSGNEVIDYYWRKGK